MPRSRPRIGIALPVLLAACTERSPAEPAEVPAVTITLESSAGHEVEWMSANARLVVTVHPPADTPEGNSGPRRFLYDTVRGTREEIDALVTHDRRSRYMIVQLGPARWLLDAETDRRVELAASRLDDHDREFFRFDRRGRTLTFLRERPDRIVVHDLASGDEHESPVPAGLQGDAEALAEPGWIHFQGFVAGEPPAPRRPHRCPLETDVQCRDDVACLADPRFITIRAFLHGDGAQIFLKEEDPAKPVLHVREAWSWDAVRGHERAGNHWLSADGCEHALPRGCDVVSDNNDGTGTTFLQCQDRMFSWSAAGLAPLPYFRRWLANPVADPRGGLWRAAAVDSPEGLRVARVSLDDGHMAVGPVIPAHGIQLQTPHGWLLRDGGPEDPRVLAYDLASGRAWQVPGARIDPAGALEVGPRWHVLDLDAGRHIVLDHAPAAVSDNGCALMPPTEADWSLRCPEQRRLDLH